MTPKAPEDRRPKISPKHSPGSEKDRESELNQGLRIKLDGEVYEVRVGDVDATMTRELRKHTGHGLMRLLEDTAEDPDIDMLSSFVWLARRIAGEDVAYDDVSVSYKQMLADGFDVSLPGEEDLDGDHPES